MSLVTALEVASKVHAPEKWKGSDRPFLYHPLTVAALVFRYGGDEEQAIAALLHDTYGKWGEKNDYAAKFGNRVADLVVAFCDPPLPEGAPGEWADYKRAYLGHLETVSEEALLVIACEELHEIGELLADLRNDPARTAARYPVPGRDLGWYFKNLLRVFYRRLSGPRYTGLLTEFSGEVKDLSAIVFEGESR